MKKIKKASSFILAMAFAFTFFLQASTNVLPVFANSEQESQAPQARQSVTDIVPDYELRTQIAEIHGVAVEDLTIDHLTGITMLTVHPGVKDLTGISYLSEHGGLQIIRFQDEVDSPENRYYGDETPEEAYISNWFYELDKTEVEDGFENYGVQLYLTLRHVDRLHVEEMFPNWNPNNTTTGQQIFFDSTIIKNIQVTESNYKQFSIPYSEFASMGDRLQDYMIGDGLPYEDFPLTTVLFQVNGQYMLYAMDYTVDTHTFNFTLLDTEEKYLQLQSEIVYDEVGRYTPWYDFSYEDIQTKESYVGCTPNFYSYAQAGGSGSFNFILYWHAAFRLTFNGTIDVFYQTEDGTALDATVLTGGIGDAYATEEKAFAGYELKEIIGETTGQYSSTAQTVTYIYIPVGQSTETETEVVTETETPSTTPDQETSTSDVESEVSESTSESETSKNPQKPIDSVQTGDDSSIFMYALILSMVGIMTTIVVKKKYHVQ